MNRMRLLLYIFSVFTPPPPPPPTATPQLRVLFPSGEKCNKEDLFYFSPNLISRDDEEEWRPMERHIHCHHHHHRHNPPPPLN